MSRFIIDIDGTLTDGKIWLDHKGRAIKGFNSKDTGAIKELISMGWEVILITASTWPGAKFYADKVGAKLIVSRNKETAIDLQSHYYAVGNDYWDHAILSKADKAFCPSDSTVMIKNIPGIQVLNSRGGEGIIAEIVERICNEHKSDSEWTSLKT